MKKNKKETMVIDKRVLEYVLTEQQEELEGREQETLCHRKEEAQVDLKSTQAQCVIGVRRSGKSTLCHKVLKDHGVRYGYANIDDDRLAGMEVADLNLLL